MTLDPRIWQTLAEPDNRAVERRERSAAAESDNRHRRLLRTPRAATLLPSLQFL